MNARVVRRLTLLLATVVLVLAAREVRAMETARAGGVAGTEMVVAGAGSGPAAAAGQSCGDPLLNLGFCLDWEPCPDLEDRVAYCAEWIEALCPEQTYGVFDFECYDDVQTSEECWLGTGDPAWMNCMYVRLAN